MIRHRTFFGFFEQISIPKGAIMRNYRNEHKKQHIKYFNSKRCDYEPILRAVGDVFEADFNSKRCDYELQEAGLNVGLM